MVKASELRLGNYVNRHFEGGKGEQTEVTVRDIFDCKRSALEPDFKFSFTGIELTEEWLIKFGFEYLSEPVPDAENPFKQNFGHDFYKNGKIKLQSHYRSFTEKTLTIWASEEHQIYYVHQIQNLFWSLTGRELELTNIVESVDLKDKPKHLTP